MFIIKLLGISAILAALIKQSAMYLPIFSLADQNTMAITAIAIPVAIFTSILFSRG